MKKINVIGLSVLLFSALLLNFGCTKDETVAPTPAAAPVAGFTSTGGNCDAPCPVTFTNTSTNATTYSWNFGDGGTSSEENPVHTYASGGTWAVVLTATNSEGKSDNFSSSVTVNTATTFTKTQLLCDQGAWKCTALVCDPALNWNDPNQIGQTDWFTYYMHACEKDNIVKFNTNNQLLAEEGTIYCQAGEDSGMWYEFITYNGTSNWSWNIPETILTVDGLPYVLETLSTSMLKYKYSTVYNGTNITITVTLTH